MTLSPALLDQLRRLRLIGLVCAGGGGVLSIYGFIYLPAQFYPAYLTSFFYWLGMALGCLALTMIHGVTGGAWWRADRRIIEAGGRTAPPRTGLHRTRRPAPGGTPARGRPGQGDASTEGGSLLEKAIWAELAVDGGPPESLGRITADRRSEPLAITQLILLYHLRSAGEGDR